MWRALSLGALVVLLPAIGCGGQAEVEHPQSFAGCVAELVSDDGETAAGDRLQMHRLRNLEAMIDLVEKIPAAERPQSFAYLASGDHLAPLGLCELLPPEADCRLLFTEVDASVQNGIQEGLGELDRRSCLDVVAAEPRIEGTSGRRRWILEISGRAASLELRITDPGGEAAALITPELLAEVDMVISHDWSGEPIGNLQVIHQFVEASRRRDGRPPLLMIEDLGAHLFPIDVSPFVRRCSTARPFGHRGSDQGPGRHGHIELGEPIFGGAVVLDFSDPWWRALNQEQLNGFFDFLLLNEFDVDRRNVLTGGSEPLVAPVLLDWWTGYGARGIGGGRFEADSGIRARMLDAAIAAAGQAAPAIRDRVACRLRLYSCLLEIRAAGEDTLDLMPSVVQSPATTALLSADMDRLYRQALRQAGIFRREREAFAPVAGELLAGLCDDAVAEVLAACAVDGAGAGGRQTSIVAFRTAYEELQASLHP